MNADTAKEILDLANSLVDVLVPGSTGNTIHALESIAVAVGRAYAAEAGKPIDSSLFTFEPPLEG